MSESPIAAQQHRHWTIYGLLSAWMLLVLLRGAQLQIQAGPQYIDQWHHVSQEQQIIPALDGRILTRDGKVVAYDETRHQIAVDYRWLEQPANELWLKRQARQRLERTDWNDDGKIESAIMEIEQDRERLWKALVEVTDVAPRLLEQRRASIQQRVERIRASVESRRGSEKSPSVSPIEHNNPSSLTWNALRRLITEELTNPPERNEQEPLVLKEELASHVILTDVPVSVIKVIESSPSRFPGVTIESHVRRIYPYGDLASHIIGVRGPLTDADSTHSESTVRSTGRSGVEQSYNDVLVGHSGSKSLLKTRGLSDEQETRLTPAIPGNDVTLTIDFELQKAIEALIDQRIPTPEMLPYVDSLPRNPDVQTGPAPVSGATIIVMNVHSGELLAAASAPRPNLSLLAEGDADYWRILNEDSRSPLYARVIAGELPPGSVFKLVSGLALIEDPRWDPYAPKFCQGFLDRPDRFRCYIYSHYGVGHQMVTLNEALSQSCNVYFFQAGRQLGVNPIIAAAQRAGFGRATGIDLPHERTGELPTPSSAENRWYPGDTLGLTIGQGSLLVTPLQIVRYVATIANGGFEVTPRVVESSHARGTSGQPQPFTETQNDLTSDPREVLSSEAVRMLQRGMLDVVENPRGTGYKSVRHERVEIAGKTGTAETGGGRGDHAWFAGYVPAMNPQYAFVVVLEHAGSGGREAGPFAHEVVDLLLKLGKISASR